MGTPTVVTGPLTPSGLTRLQDKSVTYLRKWAKARGNVLNSLGNGTINLVGDSTVLGVGTGTGAQFTDGGRPKCIAAQLVARLNAIGIPARNDSVFGCGFTTAGALALRTAFDTRLTAGASWAQDVASLGGASFTAGTGITSATTFAPTLAYDRVDVYYRRVTSGGGVTVTSASGGTDTWSTAGSSGVIKRTVSLTRGTGTLSITPDGVGVGFFLIGFECWDSTVSQVLVRNLGQSGSKASDWIVTTNPYSVGSVLAQVTADFTYIKLGLNDAAVPVTPATFQTNLTTLTAICTGDVAYGVANESSSGWNVNATLSLQRQLAGVMRGFGADGHGCIDLPARFGDYTTANANGYQANDPHPNAVGYGDEVSALMAILTR